MRRCQVEIGDGQFQRAINSMQTLVSKRREAIMQIAYFGTTVIRRALLESVQFGSVSLVLTSNEFNFLLEGLDFELWISSTKSWNFN